MYTYVSERVICLVHYNYIPRSFYFFVGAHEDLKREKRRSVNKIKKDTASPLSHQMMDSSNCFSFKQVFAPIVKNVSAHLK